MHAQDTERDCTSLGGCLLQFWVPQRDVVAGAPEGGGWGGGGPAGGRGGGGDGMSPWICCSRLQLVVPIGRSPFAALPFPFVE